MAVARASVDHSKPAVDAENWLLLTCFLAIVGVFQVVSVGNFGKLKICNRHLFNQLSNDFNMMIGKMQGWRKELKPGGATFEFSSTMLSRRRFAPPRSHLPTS